MKQLQRNQKGFTIIEVMIVLVIAAVILLIVFLAVPALQRNSRNTQRKNDVANVLAGINEYASNHNGELPGSETTLQDEVLPNVGLGFYKKSEVVLDDTAAEETEMVIFTESSCGVQNDSPVPVPASSRQFVAMFALESADGLDQVQCQEG